jgi:hypothetical protein
VKWIGQHVEFLVQVNFSQKDFNKTSSWLVAVFLEKCGEVFRKGQRDVQSDLFYI